MTKIIQRHDTATNWTAANPILAAGEMGVEYEEGTVTFTLSDAVITNGTPTFNNGLVSNFSTSNYYSMNTMLVEEIVIQFTTGSEITQGQYISTYPSLNIENGKLRLGLPSGFQQLMAVSASTQYTIKVINYSSKIEVYSNSTLIATFDTSLSSGGPRFGSNTDGYPFLGTIDFRNTSINGVSLTNKTEVFSGASRLKFGDGTTTWVDLAYAAGEGGGGGGTTLTSTDGTTTYSKLALGDNLVVDSGDIAWTNPQMTSNSQDGYIATASISSSSTDSAIYKAFDKDTSTSENCWYTGNGSMPQWIMLECPETVRLTSCTIANEVSTPENFKNAYIQGSNDGSTFDTLYTITDRPNTTGYSETYTFENTIYYKYLRVYFTASYSRGISIQEIEFKGFVKDPSAVPSLNVNIDELGNEVNTLANTKQEKFAAGTGLEFIQPSISNIIQNGGVLDSNNIYKCYDSSSGTYGQLTSKELIDFSTLSSYEIGIKFEYQPSSDSKLKYGFEAPSSFLFGYWNSAMQVSVYPVKNYTQLSIPFTSGNIYYLKFTFTGNQYILKYGTTGWDGTFTQLWGTSSSAKVNPTTSQTIFGGKNNSANYLPGGLYTEESYYILNGTKYPLIQDGPAILTLSTNKATTSSLGVVQPDGTSITVSEAGVISGQDVKAFTGYSDTGTLVLKSINGVLQWVAEG